MNDPTISVRINHPYLYANTGEVLDLPPDEAKRLMQQGARPASDLVIHVGGGWYEVELHNPVRFVRIHGKDRALRALRANTDDI